MVSYFSFHLQMFTFLHSPLPLAVVGQKLNFTKVKLKNKTAITEEFL